LALSDKLAYQTWPFTARLSGLCLPGARQVRLYIMKHYANWWARKLNPGAACAAHALHNSQSLLTRPVESARASAASPPRTCLPPGKPFWLSAGRGNATAHAVTRGH